MVAWGRQSCQHATTELPVGLVADRRTMNDDDIDRLLRALSDATRRHLLDRLRDAPGLTQGELADSFPQSRQALSKHLAALEAVDLVVTVWRGREKLHYLNPVPLQALPARWVTTTAREHSAALAALQRALAAEGSR
jgi:DNA-binding transcriptional ArsR family regulator